MFNDFTGGTGLLGDCLFVVACTLRASFYEGKHRVMRLNARIELTKTAPILGRLNIDGRTYRG